MGKMTKLGRSNVVPSSPGSGTESEGVVEGADGGRGMLGDDNGGDALGATLPTRRSPDGTVGAETPPREVAAVERGSQQANNGANAQPGDSPPQTVTRQTRVGVCQSHVGRFTGELIQSLQHPNPFQTLKQSAPKIRLAAHQYPPTTHPQSLKPSELPTFKSLITIQHSRQLYRLLLNDIAIIVITIIKNNNVFPKGAGGFHFPPTQKNRVGQKTPSSLSHVPG